MDKEEIRYCVDRHKYLTNREYAKCECCYLCQTIDKLYNLRLTGIEPDHIKIGLYDQREQKLKRILS